MIADLSHSGNHLALESDIRDLLIGAGDAQITKVGSESKAG